MMKRRMMKTAGLLLLLMLCAMLTGCYKDRDPWPASANSYTEAPPTETVTVAPPTAEPVPAAAPDVEEVQDFWADEPTRVPGGSVEPGTNG